MAAYEASTAGKTRTIISANVAYSSTRITGHSRCIMFLYCMWPGRGAWSAAFSWASSVSWSLSSMPWFFLLPSNCPPGRSHRYRQIRSKMSSQTRPRLSPLECEGCNRRIPSTRPPEPENMVNKSTSHEKFNAGKTSESWTSS